MFPKKDRISDNCLISIDFFTPPHIKATLVSVSRKIWFLRKDDATTKTTMVAMEARPARDISKGGGGNKGKIKKITNGIFLNNILHVLPSKSRP